MNKYESEQAQEMFAAHPLLVAFVEDWLEVDGDYDTEGVDRAARWAARFGWIPKDERPLKFLPSHD